MGTTHFSPEGTSVLLRLMKRRLADEGVTPAFLDSRESVSSRKRGMTA